VPIARNNINSKNKAMNLQSIYIILLMTIAINCSAESNKVAILHSDMMLEHRTGENHPEKPERLSSAVSAVKKNKALSKHFIWPAISKASNDHIRLAHTDDYINLVKSEVERLDGDQQVFLSTGDVVISKDSDEAARFAVGAGIAGIDQIMAKKAASAFALVRPPGHHATSNRGMGFCVYNNIAVAAKYLQKEYGLKRILIVDYDVHHGNGTQDIFYSDESVFYFSVHQHPFYPGTGRENETGQGKGKGTTLNVELPEGSGDKLLVSAFEQNLVPAMKNFNPDFILVSSGFDGHKDDLLGGLSYTSNGYKSVTTILTELANKYADGRIMFMLEGGYTASATNDSIIAVLEALTETSE
jgi:acetoin utilization deacetylase AcuC-like enzyme